MTGRHADAIVALLAMILGASIDVDPDRPTWLVALIVLAGLWVACRAIGHREAS